MLTRLKISGFKNLYDVEIYFGPFTCIAGPNGSGKSNLFDAIIFLSSLASGETFMNAACRVRDESGRTSNARNIFLKTGNEYAREISFEAEMLIPREGIDDLGQQAEANITFVTYKLKLGYREDTTLSQSGAIEIIQEQLSRINVSEASKHLRFPKNRLWLNSVVQGKKGSELISTDDTKHTIKLHQDKNILLYGDKKVSGGRPREFPMPRLPRTVLSSANATESPTALLTRQEMQSWRLLQLEPSALRRPDDYNAQTKLGSDGSHLPATLFNLAHHPKNDNNSSPSIYDQVTFSLSQLIDDINDIKVDADPKREIYTIEVADKYGTYYPARSLSDGTLRFLALAVMKLDTKTTGLICLEEPENGIHPERIPAIIRILREIAVDTNNPIGENNPLRQVIVNTHSPAVVPQVSLEDLLVIQMERKIINRKTFMAPSFKCVDGSWRAKMMPEIKPIEHGVLLPYLNPVASADTKYPEKNYRRVADIPHFQFKLPFNNKQ